MIVIRPRPQQAPRNEIAAVRVSRDQVDFVNQANVPLISIPPSWEILKYIFIAGELGVPMHDDRQGGVWGDVV